MTDFTSIIGRWPSLTEFASDMGVSYGQAKQWKRRNSIPPEYWQRLMSRCRERRYGGITADLLARVAANVRPPRETAA